ncbi:hypothetical protein OCU04_004286 [Sclerotinia nivalis]|uniref:Uncharacterized protein n=1 Tax=Sclerotinia nivalis TaxID=352851 RepID=A0A9X0DKG6_9HELO|nr:hypothetical protein OCU04_004286 [Sclerotinia nivalis]
MSLAYFMDITPDKLTTNKNGAQFYSFGNDHYYYLNPDGSQLYACGSWKLRINTIGYRIWIPQQREFAYEPAEMRTRFIFNRTHHVIYRETRECLRDIGAPSLGRLIVRFRRGVMESCLQNLEERGDSARESQHFHGLDIDLDDWEWKAGKGYERWLLEERKRLEDGGLYSEYNVWVDTELERVRRDMGYEMGKESTKVEGVKEEPMKQEAIEEENTKQQFIKNDIVKQEDIIKQENTTEQDSIEKEVTEPMFIKKEIIEDEFFNSET